MKTIKQNLDDVRTKIRQTAEHCGRTPENITLLAVSKTKSCDAIQHAIDADQRQFGENYAQEGVEKIQFFARQPDLIWHFIGPLQSNKTRLVATHFDWCHTLARKKIAERLNAQRPNDKPALNILIQVNISDELSKSGIALVDIEALAEHVMQLPRLTLRGLMAIPTPNNDYQQQFACFQKMANAFTQLKTRYPQIDTLSMGMTDDMPAAITAGSTLVRIGTAIFGERHNSSR